MAIRGRPKTRKAFPRSDETPRDGHDTKPKQLGTKPHLSEFEKIISKEDTTRLLDYLLLRAKKAKTNRRKWTMNYLMVLTILRAGLRASELGKLRVDDCFLDVRPPVIKIAGKMRGDWEKDAIYVPEGFAIVLKKWIEKDKPYRYVFETKWKGFKKGIDRVTLWFRLKKIFKILKMNPKYNIHSLRHRYGTDTYRAWDKDIEMTRRQMRHRHIETTTRYIHFAKMEKEAAKHLDRLERQQNGKED